VIGMSKYNLLHQGVAESLKEITFSSITLLLDANRSQLRKAMRDFQESQKRRIGRSSSMRLMESRSTGRTYLIPVDAQLATGRRGRFLAFAGHGLRFIRKCRGRGTIFPSRTPPFFPPTSARVTAASSPITLCAKSLGFELLTRTPIVARTKPCRRRGDVPEPRSRQVAADQRMERTSPVATANRLCCD
jgi:hypothetical protein